LTGEPLKLKGTPNDLSINSEGDLIIVSNHNSLEILKGKKITETFLTKYEPSCLSISPNNKLLAVGSSDKKIRIYSIEKEIKEIYVIEDKHSQKITSIKFSPNGKLLAAGDSSREIIVYDTDNWKEKYTELTYHASSVTDMCWSPNSTYLVSGSVDKTIIVWDFEQKKRISIQAHLLGVKSVSFVDGNTVISAGGDFRIRSWKFSFDSEKK